MNAPMPRQSIFPGSSTTTSVPLSTHYLSSLQTSIHTLEHSVQVLSHTNTILGGAVADVPRLNTVLTSKRHFDIVTETQVTEAKKQLEEEVRPHLKELLRRGEEQVERESAEARRAKNKVAQLTARLEQIVSNHGIEVRGGSSARTTSAAAGESQSLIALRQREHQRRADLERTKRRRLHLETELKLLEEEVEREEMEAQLLLTQGKTVTAT